MTSQKQHLPTEHITLFPKVEEAPTSTIPENTKDQLTLPQDAIPHPASTTPPDQPLPHHLYHTCKKWGPEDPDFL